MRKYLYSFSAFLVLAGCALFAQQAVAIFHNFKYPQPGYYRQTGQGYRDGKPFGEPVTDTHCVGFTSGQNAENIKKMQATMLPNCSMKVVTDTTTMAESVQTCDPGSQQTVIRSTSRRVDDLTVTMETQMSKGGRQLSEMRSTLSYLGACPAGTQAPAAGKASAEDCAGLPQMREEAKTMTVESCHTAGVPAAYVARCEASAQMIRQKMEQLETMCKK